MKKTLFLTLVAFLVLALAFSGTAIAAPKGGDANTITEGEVYYSSGHYLEGQPIPTGYDPYGYNYQAHMFKGSYVNVYLGKAGYPAYNGDDDTYLAENPGAASHWAWPYRDWQVIMKWNDAWLSNKDRDLDGALDRHWGFPTYIGSGAWENYKDFLYDEDGNVISSSTCKIIAPPSDAYLKNDVWCSANGIEIGPVIWGEFAVVQETVDGELTYSSPLRSGLGGW